MKKIVILGIMLFSFVAWCTPDQFSLDEEFYGTGVIKEISFEEFKELKNQNYLLFTFNNFCALAVPCEDIFKDFATTYHIDFLSMKFEEFKKTPLHKTVSFAPSVLIIHQWNIVAFLDSEKEEDLERFQDVEAFKTWLEKYVSLTKE